MTFEAFAWKWFEDYVVANNKYSEQIAKRHILAASLVPFFGSALIENISAHDIELYKAHTLKKQISRKTVNNRLTVLSKCLSTAYEWLQLEGAPPKMLWLKCTPPTIDYLSPDEAGRLLHCADGVVYELILTALRTGMRQGELRGLQWSSIDWQNRTITVRHTRCDLTKTLTSPKSNRERYIPMDIDVELALSNRRLATGYVFADAGGQPFSKTRLIWRLAAVCRRAGLRRIGWHTLRHTFASQLAAKGAPMSSIQMLMGHSTVTTTMRYAHLAPSTLRKTIDMLNPKTAFTDFGQPVGNQWQNQQRVEMTHRILSAENR